MLELNLIGGDNLIETIIGIIANIFSIFGISIDIKKLLDKFKNKTFCNICILAFACICCTLVVCFYIYKQKSIIITKVTLSEEILNMHINDTHTLIATVLYSNNSTNSNVLWSSSNNSVATVDQNGTVTALADGNATIIAQASKNNSTEIAECNIIVKSPPIGYTISVH